MLAEKVRELKELTSVILNSAQMTVDVFKVRYTAYTSNRFDSKAFKSTHSALYDQYCKPVESRRFSIN